MSTTTIERTADSLAGKYLTFFLAGEEYGVEILRVQEIIGMMPITRVPNTPAHIKGVINLRGKVIPIMDLREKFGMPAGTEAEQVMIVVQVAGRQVGVVVDKVSEVATIGAADIDATPDFGAGVHTEFLLGLGKSQGKLKLLLDIERVLTTQDVIDLGAFAGATGELAEAA
ncbi:MAG: chemotaxis protein CheW [Gemmatimonadaceae bacterium]|jgi:purine-binding chemotaxis protein CheW|nr:chemotaxis protein CheW [Gemmatimonadaceae bacterium]MCU0627369.1 chemotaxis protein CheW [Gemmatimonadaceae bacterium]